MNKENKMFHQILLANLISIREKNAHKNKQAKNNKNNNNKTKKIEQIFFFLFTYCANKHINRFSKSLVVREFEVKTTMRHTYTYTSILK